MADESQPRPLDYLGPQPPYWRGRPPKRVKLPEDAEARRWRYRRVLLRVAVVAFFLPIAFYFGPNMIMFGKLTGLSPADSVSFVQEHGVPVVRAIKEYQRDTGKLPDNLDELAPKYLPAPPQYFAIIGPRRFALYGTVSHLIIYDFTPGVEGWTVRGPFANGPIPLPPVTIGPPTRPAAPGK